MRTNRVLVRCFGWCSTTLLFALCVAGCATTTTPSSHSSSVPAALDHVTAGVQDALNHLDSDVQDAANQIAPHKLSDDDTRRILRGLLEKHTFAIDACTVDLDGRIVAAEPAEYKSLEGTSIDHDGRVARLVRTKHAALSGSYTVKQERHAVDLDWPVLDSKGAMIGAVSIAFRPAAFLGLLISPHVSGLPVDFWVMQKDGTILYDPDTQEVGLNVLTDPLYEPYKGLRSVSREMARSETGSGTYDFTATGLTETVTKQTYWETVRLHETEWRIAHVQVVSGNPTAAKREFSDLEVLHTRDALRRLSGDAALRNYIKADNIIGIEGLLKQFFEANPGLYAVQWVDLHGVVRVGYPKENSLRDYDLHRGANQNDPVFLSIVERGKESWTTAPFAQGKQGLVNMTPVGSTDSSLGMLYFVQMLP